MTSLPRWAPDGVMPGLGGVLSGTVPPKKQPLLPSNIAITKSPARLARFVHRAAAALWPSRFSAAASRVNATKMSALFSMDLPGMTVLGITPSSGYPTKYPPKPVPVVSVRFPAIHFASVRASSR